MVNSAVRQLLLILVIAFAVGCIAMLAFFGLLDPNGPIGPGGILASFCCSLVVLVAVIGLSRGSSPVQLFEEDLAEESEEPDEGNEDLESTSTTPPSRSETRYSTITFAAFAVAYFIVVMDLVLQLLTHWADETLILLVLTVVTFLASLISMFAAAFSLASREARPWITLTSAVMSLPIALWTGLGLWRFLGYQYFGKSLWW